MTPARIRWSVLTTDARSIPRRTGAADFRRAQAAAERSTTRSTPLGRAQNRAWQAGHYRFYLASRARTSRLPAGVSRLTIEAVDTRGNRVVA